MQEYLIKMAIRSGQPIPESIANAPQLMFGSDLYFDAYVDLSSDRNSTNGIGSIGWSKIVKYCEFYEFDKETTENLLYVLIRVDMDFTRYINSKKPDNG